MSRSGHTYTFIVLLLVIVSCFAPAAFTSEKDEDVPGVEQLLQKYRAAEDAKDYSAQIKLMAPDRIWINSDGDRRTDNAANMAFQQAGIDNLLRRVPGLKFHTMDQDVLIRFHAGGRVAIVSFHRKTLLLYPAGTPRDVIQENGSEMQETGTLVLEKQSGEWKIIHTHWSSPKQD